MMRIDSAKIVNAQKLRDAILDAFEDWTEIDINDDHWRYQFIEREWNYDGETRRKNQDKYPGLTGSPRNIEDLGDLYKSGVDSYEFKSDNNKAIASWRWDAKNSSGQEYAWYVHEGEGTNRSARPFTDDISIASSFWLKSPGESLKMRMQAYLDGLNAR
jgi:hypothetical protein